MDKAVVKDFLNFPFHLHARKRVFKYLWNRRASKIKLVMTLCVKNEEALIEKNIRFHKAMGVDGFIVTSHNSTDRTNEILERLKAEGIVWDIIYRTEEAYNQHIFVGDMIKLAKRKYKADWIINADADEFYYSKDLDLKKSIYKYHKTNVNVLRVNSLFLFPDGRADFLNCPFFVKCLSDEEKKLVPVEERDCFESMKTCPKVIHKTKGFRAIQAGNHFVRMRHNVEVEAVDIRLYHFHMKNYDELVSKVKRWEVSAPLMRKSWGMHVKNMVKQYHDGTLRQSYDFQYGEEYRKLLLREGVVMVDKSIANFISHYKI